MIRRAAAAMIDAVFVFMLTQNAADAMVKFFYGPVAWSSVLLSLARRCST